MDADVFPPLRAQAPEPSIFLPYQTEDIAFEEEYLEFLTDLGWSDVPTDAAGQAHHPSASSSAWSRLPELVSDISDGISDSESIVSIGELGDEGRLDATSGDRDSVPDENSNSWEVRACFGLDCNFASLALTRKAYGVPFLPFCSI